MALYVTISIIYRIYPNKETRMKKPYEYDLVVIGAGPAGEKGAAQAAYFGKKVAVVDRLPTNVGGASLNTGTHSKALRETALAFSGLRQRRLYGIDYSLNQRLNISRIMTRERAVVKTERAIIAQNLERHHIETVWGRASLPDPHTVRVVLKDGRLRNLSAEVILVATGSSPFHPSGVPFNNPHVHDSDSILRLKYMPRSLAIIGGGVIGSEYASVFSALGVKVTLVDGRERLLPFLDAEIAGRLRDRLERNGLHFIFNTRVEKTTASEQRVHVTLNTGQVLNVGDALFAAGRQSNVEGLGLEALGVALGPRGLVLVNDMYQTSIPNIYAAGDVIGFPALASTSMEQGRVAMVHAFDLHYKERVSPVVPLAVYTIPEIGMAGLTEEECRQKNIPCLVGRAFYANNRRGQIIGDTDGMMKLVFSQANKKLLGVHIIGELASELIHIGTQVIAGSGTIDAFIEAVYNYPTITDSYKYAAYDGLGKWNELQEER
jgi:NAD(P) transhydrogenase